MWLKFSAPIGFAKKGTLDSEAETIESRRESGDDPQTEEGIALVKRSASVLQCTLCSKEFGDYGSFGSHVREVHKMKWPRLS